MRVRLVVPIVIAAAAQAALFLAVIFDGADATKTATATTAAAAALQTRALEPLHQQCCSVEETKDNPIGRFCSLLDFWCISGCIKSISFFDLFWYLIESCEEGQFWSPQFCPHSWPLWSSRSSSHERYHEIVPRSGMEFAAADTDAAAGNSDCCCVYYRKGI
jgi:hypothetical protein